MEVSYQQKQAPQKNAGPNLTGIPTQMKLDFEQRSGLSFDDVRVHYSSERPAQLQAFAYTQGTQVYLGPGQERCLSHELGHIIQQKRGNVPVTHRINGFPVNADPLLEAQADAFAFGSASLHSQPVSGFPNAAGVIQAMRITEVPPEEEGGAYITVDLVTPDQKKKEGQKASGNGQTDPSVETWTELDFYKQFLVERDDAFQPEDDKVFRDFLQYIFSDPEYANGISFTVLLEEYVIYYRAMESINMKKVNQIYQNQILLSMQSEYFPSGLQTQFRRYCIHGFAEDKEFEPSKTDFVKYLEPRMKPRGGKLLRKLDVMKLNRPNWTPDIRNTLGKTAPEGVSNTNIRHVVRNFNLKLALSIYFKNTGLEGLGPMALALNIPEMPPAKLLRSIYNKVYLNLANLWIGDGPVNQAIGFLATPLENYGKAILNGEELDMNKLKKIIDSSLACIKGRARQSNVINNLPAQIFSCLSSCEDDEDRGLFLTEIGRNLGFDLIDDATEDAELVRRQSMLIEVEMRLRNYIESNGAEDDLIDIFCLFLGLPRPNNPAESTDANAPDAVQDANQEDEWDAALDAALDTAVNAQDTDLQEILKSKELTLEEKIHMALYNTNNCLINAIAQAVNAVIPPIMMIDLRNQLWEDTDQEPGDMLDPAIGNTLGIILDALGWNPLPVLIINDNGTGHLYVPSANRWEEHVGSPEDLQTFIGLSFITIRYSAKKRHFFFQPAIEEKAFAEDIYWKNNCLITAISDAMNVPEPDENMIRLRERLAREANQDLGELLNPTEGNTLGIIFQELGEDPVPVLIIEDGYMATLLTPAGDSWTMEQTDITNPKPDFKIPEGTIIIQYSSTMKHYFFDGRDKLPTEYKLMMENYFDAIC